MARQAPRPSGRRPSAPARGGTRSRQTGTTRPALDTRLRILDGASAGTEYAIAGSIVRIGRGDDNDIALPDSNCSRNHAELVRDGSGRYLVRDVGSRNGIQVNRKKVPQAVLTSGDRVTIGSTTVEFLSGGDEGGASTGSGGSAVRWLAVAVGAAVIGFAIVSFSGRTSGPQTGGSGGPIVIGMAPDKVLPGATPPPAGEAGVSIASLFATAQTAPVGNQKGSEVSRNQTTKPAVVNAATQPNISIPTGGSNEKIVAAIMAEGERAYGSGKLIDARAFFDRAVKLDPNCERCVNRYDFLDRQITKEITDAMAVGVTYLDNQRWDQAIMAFEKVKFLDPNPTSVNNANATAYIDDAKQKKAAGGR